MPNTYEETAPTHAKTSDDATLNQHAPMLISSNCHNHLLINRFSLLQMSSLFLPQINTFLANCDFVCTFLKYITQLPLKITLNFNVDIFCKAALNDVYCERTIQINVNLN